MNTANKECQKYRKEPEIEIRKLINQYLAASSPIIQIANFFLPPNLPSSRSLNSNSNVNSDTNSTLPSSFNEIPTIAPNALAQHQALELIQKAKSKISKYETLMIYTSNKDF
ncbi:11689_t:CDS:1 [Dentiscutata erythropus]|uniref:11689_t:CDS:1 n=1 Tax=Dentiscutata erythropus TaxID=1348616 RepID=A0A9N8VY87_9GLOM|nr:11689_t:CDS:1 [Dentiscutata erythropus]